MQIIKYELLTEADLLGRLKRTRLRGFDRAEVYRDATLEVIETDPAALTPAQRYVLQDGVQAILDVADAFEPMSVDIFALRGALLFWPEGSDPENDPPIPFLPPATYRLTAEASGFKRYVRDNLAAGANERLGIDIQMEVGAVSETISVIADAAVLQTTTASTGQLISSAQIENMPVSGRTPLALAQ